MVQLKPIVVKLTSFIIDYIPKNTVSKGFQLRILQHLLRRNIRPQKVHSMTWQPSGLMYINKQYYHTAFNKTRASSYLNMKLEINFRKQSKYNVEFIVINKIGCYKNEILLHIYSKHDLHSSYCDARKRLLQNGQIEFMS